MQATQIDCRSCGAKLDIHTGLRARTFVCEYCGAVCDHEKVVALQDLQETKRKYRPWSHLRLGLKAEFFGHEYQIVGRVRCSEEYWWWDEWLLYAETGFPLWLQEGEGGFKIFRVFYPTVPVNVRGARGSIKLDKNGGTAKVRERGTGTVAFIEGELTWAARPGEQFHYVEAGRGKQLYSIEYTDDEFQFLRGEARYSEHVYERFSLSEPVPPPLTFDDEDAPQGAGFGAAAALSSSPDVRFRCPECSRQLKSAQGLVQHARDKHGVKLEPDTLGLYAVAAGGSGASYDGGSGELKVSRSFGVSGRGRSWAVVIGAALFALGVGVCGVMRAGSAKLHRAYSFPAVAATSPGAGALLTDSRGRPVAIRLPPTKGVYELRMASSPLRRSGQRGGHCYWMQVDFLKERARCALNKAVYADLVKEDLLPEILGRIARDRKLSPTFNWGPSLSVQPTCHAVTVRIKGGFSRDIGAARQVAAQAKKPAVKLLAVDSRQGTARFALSKADLDRAKQQLDPWKRFEVVHRISTWFGRYWGVSEGERWNENTYVQNHFFKTEDRGPYYLRAYTGNCRGAASRRVYNTVYGKTLTVAVYTDATDTTPIFVMMGVMLVFLFVYVMVRADYFFSGD